ncbi:MAG: energy-coupling factor transporter transmembrane protein EcfT [Chloroflexota bacterium]|nr:energy-coupling factor transporter transmembrane protein EcfT [Chloroflexota bacterium]
MRSVQPLDVRVWLLWAAVASIPPLIGRNPFVIAEVLLMIVSVRAAWMPVAPQRFASWQAIVRIVLVVTTVGVLFNVVTVHSGDQVLVRVPESVPIAGGPITLNALVFGLLSGGALVALVLIGTTAGALLDWPELMRVLPERAAPVAVAGSVTWALLPGTTTAWREIREAQAARGHCARGVRDLPTLLVPLLDGGLERALTMAEVLEARGFGAEPDVSTGGGTQVRWRGAAFIGGLAAAALAAYAIAVGLGWLAVAAAGAAVTAILLALQGSAEPRRRRTRYRSHQWSRGDGVVAGCVLVALAVTLVRSVTAPAGLHYDPYPSVRWPAVDLLLLVALALLLAPALIAPPVMPERSS